MEQYALDFLAFEIYPKEKKARVFKYDGRVTRGNTSLESVAGAGFDFFMCKHSQDQGKPDSLNTSKYWLDKAIEWEKHVRSQPFDSTNKVSGIRLSIPKAFKAVDKFTYQKPRRGKISHSLGKLKYRLFGNAYNVILIEAVELKQLYLVRINAAGVNGSGGKFYYLLLDTNGKVVEWCRTSWMS